MLLAIIFLSYLLGCASTIGLLIYLYTHYAFNPPKSPVEQEQEQYETFQPLPDSERAKNSAVDAVNYLFQFLFQELKDSSRLRRYIMHKLNTEFKELQNSRTGKFFLQSIVIQSFSIGQKCPVFSDIKLEKQERDERNMIKEFAAQLDAVYEDGFSVTLEITLVFGQKCQLFIKVKRIQGRLRLEFRREPFCHWLLVFQDEPLIDFEVKSVLATVESPQLAQIITQQLRRAIRRKQTWPSYKIRFQPFFMPSKDPIPADILTAKGSNLIPGKFDICIKYCDRLSIPLCIFDKQKNPSVQVFITVNINEDKSAEYLCMNREQWPRKELELTRNLHKLIVKEVNYMDRTELLIEQLDPIPDGIEDEAAIKAAIEDKNIYLIKIFGQDAVTLKQVTRLLKAKPTTTPAAGPTTTTANGNEDKMKIVVGMPLLHSVRIPCAIDSINAAEAERYGGNSPTAATIDEKISATPASLRKRDVATTVKFDKNVDAIGLVNTPSNGSDEQAINSNIEDINNKPLETNVTKTPRQSRKSAGDFTVTLMNASLLGKFNASPTERQNAQTFINFNHKFELQVGPNEKFLNICLWCKPPRDCNVPNAGVKLILIGYATVALSEIVLDAHMSYKRETQMTINFRSPYVSKPNIAILSDPERKKRVELSTHKGYDEDLCHGFVTINVRHYPEVEAKLNPQEKKEQYIANEQVAQEIVRKQREDERQRDQLKYINTINEEHESLASKETDHIFEDAAFTISTICASCNRKIWLKSGRQCRDCQVSIHKKCQEKFCALNPCTHEPINTKTTQIVTPTDDELKNLVNIDSGNIDGTIIMTDDTDSVAIKLNSESTSNSNTQRAPTTTVALAAAFSPPQSLPPATPTAQRFSTKAAAAISALDSTARRSFRAFGHRNAAQPSTHLTTTNLTTTSELSKSDESLETSSTSSTVKSTASNAPANTSSRLASAASSAYTRLREFKAKRLPATTDTSTAKKSSLSAPQKANNESIPAPDLRDILTRYLSDESNNVENLEQLLHEKTVDDSTLYAKVREVGPELFPDLTPDERKQRIDSEISRLQQEIDLQCQVRDEMLRDCDNVTDENEKRRIRAKISNIDEKVQALGALTILYCSGLKHCSTQLAAQDNMNDHLYSDAPNDNDVNDLDDSQFHDSDEKS